MLIFYVTKFTQNFIFTPKLKPRRQGACLHVASKRATATSCVLLAPAFQPCGTCLKRKGIFTIKRTHTQHESTRDRRKDAPRSLLVKICQRTCENFSLLFRFYDQNVSSHQFTHACTHANQRSIHGMRHIHH